MKPRDRVILALKHREPDRIPIDLGATIVTSIAQQTYLELTQHLGLPIEDIKILDTVQQRPSIDEALLQRFAVDFRLVQLPPATAGGVDIFEEGDYFAFFDRWGSKLHRPKQGSLYFDWVDCPLKAPTLQAFVPPENIVAAFDTAQSDGRYLNSSIAHWRESRDFP